MSFINGLLLGIIISIICITIYRQYGKVIIDSIIEKRKQKSCKK